MKNVINMSNYTQVFGTQKSNNSWVYYDSPVESKKDRGIMLFHLGLRLGLGW